MATSRKRKRIRKKRERVVKKEKRRKHEQHFHNLKMITEFSII